MFGAIFAGLLLVGAGVRGVQRSYEDYISKESSIKKCYPYYIDSHGAFRSTWDNHKVLVSVRDENGDLIDKDLVTGKALRNYSAEKRSRELREQEKKLEQNRDNLYIARSTGQPYYLETYFDSNGKMQYRKTDVKTGKKYIDIKDNQDVETGLYVGGIDGKNTYEARADAMFINEWLIYDPESNLRKNRTIEEARAYAKEIGALTSNFNERIKLDKNYYEIKVIPHKVMDKGTNDRYFIFDNVRGKKYGFIDDIYNDYEEAEKNVEHLNFAKEAKKRIFGDIEQWHKAVELKEIAKVMGVSPQKAKVILEYGLHKTFFRNDWYQL